MTCAYDGCVVNGEHDAHYTAEYVLFHSPTAERRLVEFNVKPRDNFGVTLFAIGDTDDDPELIELTPYALTDADVDALIAALLASKKG